MICVEEVQVYVFCLLSMHLRQELQQLINNQIHYLYYTLLSISDSYHTQWSGERAQEGEKVAKIVILGKDNIFYYLIGRYGQGRPQKALVTQDIARTREGLYRKREAVPERVQNNAMQCGA